MYHLVYYHHPCAENLSLKYSSTDPSDVVQRRYEDGGKTKLLGYPFNTPIYVLYEGNDTTTHADEIEYGLGWLEERLDGLPRSTQVITFRLLELLQAAVDVREEDEFRLYKDFEPMQVHRALENVSWGASLPVVAGELMSNLVLRHPLPNANHRTSIAMLQFCIESVAPSFEMPTTHVDDHTWKAWVDPYIVESKRLITVRRNNVRFKRLAELGVDVVERKGGIQIWLTDYELDMHWRDALTKYAERHEAHCTQFVEEIFERTGRSDLTGRKGPTRDGFAEFLESGGDGDFRELF